MLNFEFGVPKIHETKHASQLDWGKICLGWCETVTASQLKGCSLYYRCSDIAKELNDFVASHGMLNYRTFGYGHSFGALCHYYGREAGLELREDIDTVLEPGMVISMEV